MITSNSFRFDPFLMGGGRLERYENDALRLSLPSNQARYCDAQIDDYHKLPRNRFPWTPPVYLEILARASHSRPFGTLGFGFWNDPFTLSLGQGGAARRLPAPPQTLWFFYGSSENDIHFQSDIPGHGWKASSVRSPSIPSLLLLFPAMGAILLSYIPFLRRTILINALKVVSAQEKLIDNDLREWHHYAINWQTTKAIFQVDEQIVMVVKNPPSGPLGFVAWIDNQYATASPERGFHFGVIPIHEPQWLEIKILSLSNMAS